VCERHPSILRCAATPLANRRDFCCGSKADVTLLNFDVRFTPNSGHRLRTLGCLLWAKSGLPHRSKLRLYSITSSAVASSVCGIVRPSALAVLRLITNSHIVGCSTGMSAGLVPLSILSTYSAVRRNMAVKLGP
jgi:hypothetical protein